MHRLTTTALYCALAVCAMALPASANDVAPGGTLRAAWLVTNTAQAVRDAASGAVRGPSYDVAVELAKRLSVPLDFKSQLTPAAVIAAVANGEADIGFVAYEPSRAGTIEFSQTYMMTMQTFAVLNGSSIKAMADIDRPGQKIAGVKDDSISLFMRRNLKQATLVEISNSVPDTQRMLNAKEIDAFGASRPRIMAFVNQTAGTRLLPDNMFGVPQTIIVPKGKMAALEAVNRYLDDARSTGLLKGAIDRYGMVGIEVGPGGSWQPKAP